MHYFFIPKASNRSFQNTPRNSFATVQYINGNKAKYEAASKGQEQKCSGINKM